jgi:hypothetical protein
MANPNTNDNSGVGVVLGILLAVIIAVGAYFFIKNEGAIPGSETTNVTIEAPQVAPSAGDAPEPAPAPAQ